jgi:hypothetical protein
MCLVHFDSQHITKNSYSVEMNYNLATLCDMKHQLDQFNCRLNYDDTRRVTKVKYHRSSTI